MSTAYNATDPKAPHRELPYVVRLRAEAGDLAYVPQLNQPCGLEVAADVRRRRIGIGLCHCCVRLRTACEVAQLLCKGAGESAHAAALSELQKVVALLRQPKQRCRPAPIHAYPNRPAPIHAYPNNRHPPSHAPQGPHAGHQRAFGARVHAQHSQQQQPPFTTLRINALPTALPQPTTAAGRELRCWRPHSRRRRKHRKQDPELGREYVCPAASTVRSLHAWWGRTQPCPHTCAPPKKTQRHP